MLSVGFFLTEIGRSPNLTGYSYCTVLHEYSLMVSLNARINGVLNDFKDQIQNQRKWIENELRRSEQEQASLINQCLYSVKERLVSILRIITSNGCYSEPRKTYLPRPCESNRN